MKKIINITICLCLTLVLFNCDEEGLNDGKFKSTPESGWIEFDSASSGGNQGMETVEIPISLPIGTNPDGQDVTYSVELISGNIPSSSLGNFTTTIPAGETTGNIVFDVVQSEGSYMLEFTLLSTTNVGFQIGLSDGTKQTTHSLFINCTQNVGTTYSGTVTIEDLGLTSTNNAAYNFTATLTQTSATGYSIDTAWGPSFVALLAGQPGLAGQYLYPGTITVAGSGAVTVVGIDAYATGGTGSYDPCDDVFTYSLTQGLFNGDFSVDVVLSPM
ncbi:MAG: hypothetical protein ACSHXF_16780 [Aquaticitalea sp.]